MKIFAQISGTFFLYLLFTNPCFAQQSFFEIAEVFNPDLAPVFSSRIFRVAVQKEAIAVKLLNGKKFAELSAGELALLFPNRKFDTKAMIAAQAKEANDYALQREQEAKDPFFKQKTKDWMIQTAKEHRKFAAYTMKLPATLQPWLVLAEGYFEGTGGFDAHLAGSVLKVHHGSLGSSQPPLRKLPVVIFLEREIKEVQISSSFGQ